MHELTAQEVANKLRASNFGRADPGAVDALTDPIADTPMVVTLDQLQPYSLNPRVTRNPRYDDLKSSIRQRGLDAPPAITRRPGETPFIIRNGGNTRLAILRELWTETRDERFFRIACLFRPWSARGEIVALTGHLCENELRGGLTFIERALGVAKARELYETECGAALTQTELARRLTSDGYPVTQSHISRMQDTVHFLLPVIPTILYGGLGKPQIEKLIALRRVAMRVWERHVEQAKTPSEFTPVFHEVLSLFDSEPSEFSVQRVQDELIGQLAKLFDADYDSLALEFVDVDSRQRASQDEQLFHVKPNVVITPPAGEKDDASGIAERQGIGAEKRAPPAASSPTGSELESRVRGVTVSPAPSTQRLDSIQRTIAEATGEPIQDFHRNVVQAVPVKAGGLHPISDVWYIEPALDSTERLRVLAAQLAREIADEARLADRIEAVKDGIGFVCTRLPSARETPPSLLERSILGLLNALSAPYAPTHRPGIDGVRLADDLGPLLQGLLPSRRPAPQDRLSNDGCVKLFRLIRLARQIIDLETVELAGRIATR